MLAAQADDVRPLYRFMLALGGLAIVILALGIVEFIYFEPPGQRSGHSARIEGVYAYDPKRKQVLDGDQETFRRDQDFAAVVDWSSLPPDLLVGARWYDGFGDAVGGVGPAPAGELKGKEVVPVETAAGAPHNLPGHYLFVVERYSGGLPLEVLGRRIVLVRRTD